MIPTPDINWLAILPEIMLALGAAAVLLVEVQWKPRNRVLAAITGGVLLLAFAATFAQWTEAQDAALLGSAARLTAFSGMVFIDGFAIFGRFLLIIVTALGVSAGWGLITSLGRRRAEAIALILLATAGFSIMVASNNLIMMFVGLEVGSIALYVLAGMTTERKGADEAAIKYFLLGSFASAVLVYGVALLYASTGQLEMLAMGQHLARFVVSSPLVLIGMGLVMVGLAFKISAAPFHSWAPDVYQGAPAGVVGYMAAVAKIGGFIVLARFLLVAVYEFESTWLSAIAIISALSMVLGALTALVQSDLKRLLAYSGVAHAGFILIGVIGERVTSLLFYLAIYAVQLVAAFAVVAAVSGKAASAAPISDFRGLARKNPALAAGFTVLLLGMAGLPPTAGFIAKFGVLADAWRNDYAWLVYVAVVATVIALAFYLRIIVTMYFEESDRETVSVPKAIGWVVLVGALITIVLGVAPGLLADIASNAFIF